MTPRRVAAAGLLVLLTALPAAAEEGVWLSRDDAAKLAGQAARAPALEDRVKHLESENAELRTGLTVAERLAANNEKIAQSEERLRGLAEKERDAYKAKTERLEKEKGKGRLWLTIQARGAMGGLLCSPAALTGVGLPIVAGCAVVGGIVGAVEALVSGE